MNTMLEKLRSRVASYGEAVYHALKALAEIPSVAEKSDDPSMPFGEDVARALALGCQMAEDAGATKVVNCGHYAYADFGEIGENTAYVGFSTEAARKPFESSTPSLFHELENLPERSITCPSTQLPVLSSLK